MLKKLLSSRRGSTLVVLLALAGAFASAFAQNGTPSNPPLTPETKSILLDRMGALILKNAFVPGLEFSRWPEFLAKNKEAIAKAETHEDFAEAVNSDLSRFFGISHIVLVTPRAATNRRERKVVGIGVMVQSEPDGLRVVSVFPDTPASEAKLEPGDLIIEADGKKLTSSQGMTGEEGSTVEIKVQRGDDSIKTFKLTRRKYNNQRLDTLTWLDPDTALVKIHTFDLNYDPKRVESLMAEAFKAKSVVLDLRSNGGGVVLNMLHLIGFFLPPDSKIGTFINRTMVNDFVKETGGDAKGLRDIVSWAGSRGLRPTISPIGVYKGNVAVLVNGGTGSASEITALSLKEYRDAPIVGTKSAGAVLVSIMAPLAEGWFLQYPLMDFVSSQGIRLEGSGVEPTMEAPTPRYREPDLAVEKAVLLLRRIELRQHRAAVKPPGDGGERDRSVA